VEAVHLSSCLLALCPFKNRYLQLLRDAFPEVSIVEGTHDDSPEDIVWFQQAMKDMLTQPVHSMSELALQSSRKDRK
jgi:hypothetical protein